MHRAVIVDAVRTPIGKIRGALSSIRPDDLLSYTLERLVERNRIEPIDVGEVFAGCANQAGEDNRNVARMAWLAAGFPYEVPALTVNRLCASGLDAVIMATRAVWCGDRDMVIAGGVESMTRAPLVMGKPEAGYAGGNRTVYDSSLGWRFPNPRLESRFPLESNGETAENVADKYGIGREEQDRFALASHERAVAAQQAGRFDDELMSVEARDLKTSTTIKKDEGPRADSTLPALAKLKPVFREGGSVTAGNSSTLNDGAAALLITSEERAAQLGVRPLATITAVASTGVNPRTMGLGPVPATRQALIRCGKTVQDLELVEINEAFAVQVLACMKDLALPHERVNVNGGAIALGHPLGSSGARILTTLVYEMRRRDAKVGLASLCVGVGQGVSVIVER